MKMNNSTVNFTTSEASTSSTTFLFGPLNILDSFNLVFGLPLYSYVLWLIITGTRSGVASEFFILNLAFCEIGNCLNSLFSTLYSWVWDPSLKPLMYFLVGLAITARPLFQCLMCVECYLAVVHPVTFLKFKPLRYRVICCTVVWIITLGSCLCLIFILDLFPIVYSWFFSLQFLLFFSIQLFCLVAVLRALKQSGPGERGRERKEENHMKRRAFHLILITTVNMAVMYVPFTITGLYFILTQRYFQDIVTVGLYCFILAGYVQTVLYLKRAGKLSCLSYFLTNTLTLLCVLIRCGCCK